VRIRAAERDFEGRTSGAHNVVQCEGSTFLLFYNQVIGLQSNTVATLGLRQGRLSVLVTATR